MTTEEFFNQDKAFNIIDFEVGDIITRVERAPHKQPRFNDNLGITIDVVQYTDGSFIGEKMEFLGIFNRMICLKTMEEGIFNGDIRKLHIEQWGNGWQKYQIPDFDKDE